MSGKLCGWNFCKINDNSDDIIYKKLFQKDNNNDKENKNNKDNKDNAC